MEIELSWPSWLQKVVLINFVSLLLLSASQKSLVSSLLSSQIQTNSSVTSLEVTASSKLSSFIEGLQENSVSKYLENQIQESRFLENPQRGSHEEASTGDLESPHDGVADYALNLESSELSSSADEGSKLNALNMILTRDEVDTEDNSIIFNETFWLSLDCYEFWKLDPPPNFMEFIPPPPIPPFLREHEITFRDDKMEQEEKENIFNDQKSLNEIIFYDQFCSLCSWANEAVNSTATIINIPKKDSKTGVSRAMVGVLVGVALLSSAIGAAIMGIFLKCRKRESSATDRGFCPLVVRSRWLNSSTQKNPPRTPSAGNESGTVGGGHRVPNEQQITSVSIGMTRSTSTSPLQTPTPDSENSGHSEDHYISAETSSSVVYAEFASNNQNHHYSEIEDIYHLPNLVNNTRENIREDTYENFGYILPEISSVRITDGSSIYAPSAYYSDISMNGIYLVNRNANDGRNRKKRKRNSKCNSSKMESFGDSCHACAQPRNQCPNYVSGSEQNFSRTFDSQLNNTINQWHEAPLQNRSNLETTFPLHNHSEGLYRVHLNAIAGSPSFSSIPSTCNNNDDPMWHVYELQTLRCSNPETRRSLPPLPRSRVPNSHRKQLRSCHPHHASSVPSEYI